MFKLAEWNQLNHSRKELLHGLHDEAEVYGLFEPVTDDPDLTYKVAYREVAMLFLHLQQHDRLPHYFIVSDTQNTNEILTRLVLDDIIQIEWEGNYVSGAAALPAIYGENIFDEHYLPGYLQDLSFKGVYYAWMLHDTDLRSIAKKLYSFNTVPWDASMKSRFSGTHSVKEFLFSCTNTAFWQRIGEEWKTYTGEQMNAWLSWSRKIPQRSFSAASTYTCKLYISPHINDLPEIFMRAIPIISASEAFSFKVGSSIQGILRPDKMLAYFHTKEALFNTARLLHQELGDYPSQGVPFTAQLNRSGLLSYGEDPPLTEVLYATEGGSWRTFITDQLALAIQQAKKNKLTWQQTMGFIRAMLMTAGVDSYNWTTVNEFDQSTY